MKTSYYGDTNIGNVRPKNEDNFVLKEVWGGTHLLAVVVDGVGGNGGGDGGLVQNGGDKGLAFAFVGGEVGADHGCLGFAVGFAQLHSDSQQFAVTGTAGEAGNGHIQLAFLPVLGDHFPALGGIGHRLGDEVLVQIDTQDHRGQIHHILGGNGVGQGAVGGVDLVGSGQEDGHIGDLGIQQRVIGGFGAAVCEALCETYPVPVVRVGVNDSYGRSGKVPELLEIYGLTAQNIADSAKRAIAMKK